MTLVGGTGTVKGNVWQLQREQPPWELLYSRLLVVYGVWQCQAEAADTSSPGGCML